MHTYTCTSSYMHASCNTMHKTAITHAPLREPASAATLDGGIWPAMRGHAPVGQLTALTSSALASKTSLQSLSGQEGHVAGRRMSESVVATVDHASSIAIGLYRMRGHRFNCCQRQQLAVPLLLCISLGRHGPLAFT